MNINNRIIICEFVHYLFIICWFNQWPTKKEEATKKKNPKESLKIIMIIIAKSLILLL